MTRRGRVRAAEPTAAFSPQRKCKTVWSGSHLRNQKKNSIRMDAVLFLLTKSERRTTSEPPCGSDRIALHQTNTLTHIFARSGGYKSHLRNHIVKPKKISWLRTPEIVRFRGFFSRLLAFSQP